MTHEQTRKALTDAVLEFHAAAKEIAERAGTRIDTTTLVFLPREDGSAEVMTGTTLPPDVFIETLEDTARSEREKKALKKMNFRLAQPPPYGKGGEA